jgi:uncharacterized protein
VKAPARQIIALGQLLRDFSLPVGSDRIQMALESAQILGVSDRACFRDGLQACLLSSQDGVDLFLHAFSLIFDAQAEPSAVPLLVDKNQALQARGEPQQIDGQLHRDAKPRNSGVEQVGGISGEEALGHRDFKQMNVLEFEQAKRVVRQLPFRLPQVSTRRWRTSRHACSASRLSLRATLKSSPGALMGELQARYERRRCRPRRLVCLVDVSASMASYAEMFVQLLWALKNATQTESVSIEVFVFGTQLHRVTASLELRDIGSGLHALQSHIVQARAGTRIASSLQEFNRTWSARVQSRKATVLLISDGLDHDDDGKLSAETRRLRSDCRRLIWLNPLLRFPHFQAKARGVKAMLEHVDQFLPVHNVASLRDLLHLLATPETSKQGR